MSRSGNPYAPPEVASSNRGVEWLQTDSAALSKTAIGLSLVYYGIVLLLISFMLTFCCIVAGLFSFVGLVVVPGILIASVLVFVGPFLCLTVPEETKSKGLIIGSIVLQVINFAFLVLLLVGFGLFGLEIFAQAFGGLSAIFFVMLMRRLAQFIGREDLASRAIKDLVLGIVVFLTAIIGVV